jgi:hypothetical protein
MIIGITGERQTGKNTLSEYIKSSNIFVLKHKKIEIKSFAAKLKDITHEIFPLVQNGDYYETNAQHKELIIPEYNMSPRDIWIKVGQELRAINPNVFVEYLINSIASYNKHYIISDVRFQNEIDYLKKAGALIIKLRRNNGLDKLDSEKQIKNFKVDIEYDNNNSLVDLLLFSQTIVKKYLK